MGTPGRAPPKGHNWVLIVTVLGVLIGVPGALVAINTLDGNGKSASTSSSGTSQDTGGAGTTLANVTSPSISNAAKVGGTIVCTTGRWSGSPTSYTYEWDQGGAAIPGATDRTYVVTSDDAGQTLTCTVTAMANSGRTVSATSAPVTVPNAPPPPPQIVWQHEFTFAFNASYGFDSFPPSRTDSANGFEVGTTYTGTSDDIAFGNVGANQVSQWTGKGEPSFAECRDALASGGNNSVVIGPTGLSLGGWVCGQTDTGLIARFRYDAGSEANSYTFFVTVWKPS